MYDDLKSVVRAYRRRHGIKATDSWAALAWIALWGLLHYVALARWLLGLGGLPNAVVLGCSIWWWSGAIIHDATHYSLAYKSTVSERIGWLGGWMFCLPSTWLRQHVTGHHVHTNVEGHDPDLYHWTRFFHVRPRHRDPTPSHGWATLVVRSFSSLLASLRGTHKLLSDARWKGCDAVIVWSGREALWLSIQWALFVGMLVFVGYRTSVCMAAVPFAVVGVLYYGFSQVSHINAESFEKGKGTAAAPQSNEWAVHQIATTRGDYGYRSRLWYLLSIGLNNQAIHHCFPSVHPCHYPALSRLMKPVFEKHGLPQNGWEQSFGDALRLHFMHLQALNEY